MANNSSLRILSQLLLLILASGLIEGKTLAYFFDVSYIEGAPDGVYKKSILAINGEFPGPTIEAEVGDVLQVDLINHIQDGQNVSIHWHGLHQRDTHCEDGTSQITQCPLKTGNLQRYIVPLTQAGTYWYHSHVNSQYTEGLWGVLIVHSKEEVYNYDGEILVTMNDWYHRTAHENEAWHISPVSRGVPPYPDSGLINAVGRYPCDPYAGLQNRTCDPALQRRPVFQVAREKTYRVRVINTAAVAAFNFSIDGHRLETIEVDGTDVAHPVLADYATLAVGQRYSFLIRTNGSLDRYLIRASLRSEMLMLLENVNINLYPESLMSDITAVLEYTADGSSPVTPKVYTEPHSYLDPVPPVDRESSIFLNEEELGPYDGVHAPDHYDQEFVLTVDFYEDHENIRRGSFNRTPFVLPDGKPMLMSLMDGEPISPKAFSLEIGYMNVVQIVLNNPFFGPHPFHLHGHSFWVLGTGPWYDGDYDPSRHNLTLTGARRDTVLLQEQSWAVIRFVADNPGIWTFHCHIDWHNLSGMALTFIEAKEEALKKVKITEEAKRVCELWEK